MAIVPSRLFVATVGLLLVGLGLNGIRTGVVIGRIGSVARSANSAWFWLRETLYLSLGVLALCYSSLRGI